MFAVRVKIISHSSCSTSAILKYFCPLVIINMDSTSAILKYFCPLVITNMDSTSAILKFFCPLVITNMDSSHEKTSTHSFDPGQLATLEASSSGSSLFSKEGSEYFESYFIIHPFHSGYQ